MNHDANPCLRRERRESKHAETPVVIASLTREPRLSRTRPQQRLPTDPPLAEHRDSGRRDAKILVGNRILNREHEHLCDASQTHS